MIKPKISIITVVYNARNELRRTLQNIVSLNYFNKEIIVVDGGSTDGTRSVIEEFSVDIHHWISEPDGGIYDAMNKGLALAEGEYVWFVNAGDMAYNEYVLDNIFDGQEHFADIYYGETLIMSEIGEIKGLRKKKLPSKLSWHSLSRGMVVCHQSVIVKRSMVISYDLSYRYSSDVDWVINILKKAKTIRYTHSIISVFAEGGISSLRRKESLKERFEIMRKHYGVANTVFNHALFIFDKLKPAYRKPKSYMLIHD